MSKMSEMESTIRELRDIASSINGIANWLTEAFGGSSDTPEEAPTPEKVLTLEEVRAILVEKSRDGEPLGDKASAASDFSTDADEDFQS